MTAGRRLALINVNLREAQMLWILFCICLYFLLPDYACCKKKCSFWGGKFFFFFSLLDGECVQLCILIFNDYC